MDTQEAMHPLRRLRTENGWSLAQLSALSGVDAAHISRIEHGDSVHWGCALTKLARVLRVPTEELVVRGQATPRALTGAPRDDQARTISAVWLGLDPTDDNDQDLLDQIRDSVSQRQAVTA